MKIEIEWLADERDCETCGSSWAEGARVLLDGNVALDLEPRAHCFDGVSFDVRDVLTKILEHLGHSVEMREV